MNTPHRPWHLRGRGGLADLLLAYDSGGEDELAAAAALLGYEARRFSPKSPAAEPTAIGLKGEMPSSVPPPEVLQAPLEDVPFWRPVSRQFREPLTMGEGRRDEAKMTCPDEPPVTAELSRWSALVPRLRAGLSEQVQGHSPDIDAIIRRLGQGRALGRLPRRLRRRWGSGLQIVIDRSQRLVPFQDDQDRTAGRLAALFPRHAVEQALAFDGFPEPVCLDAHGRFANYRPPLSGWLVVVLGDLGCLGPAPERLTMRWEAFGRRLQAAGCRPVALTPCPPSRWLPDRLGSWTMLPWEQPAHGDSARPEERARRLLRLLSPAVRIDPGLLRAIRLLLGPGADAGTEADVWNHSAMVGQSRAAGALSPAETLRLRQELLKEEPAALYAAAIACIHRWRGSVAPEVWAEELLNLPPQVQSLLPETIRTNDLPAAAQRFKDLAGQVEHVPGGTGWYRRVCGRAGAAYYQQSDPELRAAQQRMHLLACGDAPSPGFDPALLPALDLPVRSIPLTQHGNALVAGTATMGIPLAEVTSRNGLLDVETEDADPFWKSGTPPNWASGWGQDEFGAWVDFTVDAVTQRMRWCPPGTFLMGSPDGDAVVFEHERPQHQVTLTTGFWLFDTPCTQELWQAVMGDNPSRFTSSPRLPVEQVSWTDVQTFLSRLNGQAPGLDLALPTEAQWEYACRANNATAPDLDTVSWYDPNSQSETHPVGGKVANAWGLHDMLGNVWEWCADGIRDYGADAIIDPIGPMDAGAGRVVRGGAWGSTARLVRAACRSRAHPDDRYDALGFRCARVQVSQAGEGGAEPAAPADTRLAERRGAQGATGAATGLLRLDHGAESARCALPYSGFRVLTDCERLTFDRITKPDWAGAIGRDRFGLWTEISVDKATQRLRWIPPGRFSMGSPADEPGYWDDERPQHQVTLTTGFWLFDTPCTQELWQAVMDDNPSRFTSSPRLPVERVNWDDVQTFLSWLNGRVPGLDLVLPTEAQWEYACRANDATAPELDTVAWYDLNSKDKTHPVAGKAANAWGLHDMLGNVLEWCADGMRDYGADAIVDPTGPVDPGAGRVVRGGAWNGPARYVRAACRSRARPDGRFDDLGFRCARVQS